MSDLVIKPVATRAEKRLFLGFPWKLYRGDPNWIPPLRLDQEELVGYKRHPFYEKNEVQTYLALRSGAVVGRIAAILNRTHNEYHKDIRGFWGFFECVDDQEAANGLFDAVKAWFAERDIHCLRGPANPSANYTLGMLIEGFDSPPYFMMTYNPEYYPRLVEGYGFQKAQDLYAYWGNIGMLPDAVSRFNSLMQQIIEHFDLTIRPLDKSRFREEIQEFLTVYNRSMSNMWGFVPMSEGEIHHAAKNLRHLLVPELALTAEVDGKMIGATFCLLDYNPTIKAIDGRLFPFGFLRLILGKRKIKKIRLISANVVPEYQRMGMGLVLLGRLVPFCRKWGMEEVEFSWIAESNWLSRGSLEKGGAKKAKTYRVYDLDLKQ
jgi:GNAT superfamily N-acetyltransferase